MKDSDNINTSIEVLESVINNQIGNDEQKEEFAGADEDENYLEKNP